MLTLAVSSCFSGVKAVPVSAVASALRSTVRYGVVYAALAVAEMTPVMVQPSPAAMRSASFRALRAAFRMACAR